MSSLGLQRIGQLLIPIATLALLAFILLRANDAAQIRTLRIAAGASTGDSFLICQALKAVAEQRYPKLRVTVLETAGSVENLHQLEDASADLATAQADVTAGPSARSVAVLFDDVFQLLTHQNSGITAFSGLRGKTIALSRGGGQFDSFLRVAAHFNLTQSDFHFIGADDQSAQDAFSQSRADALFRVRSLGNPAIGRLVEAGNTRLVAIPHASAMRIEHAGFEPTLIPAGAYRGEPPVPPEDLPSIAVHRFLLARSSADPVAIRWLTSALLEDRQAVMDRLPATELSVRQLLAQTRRPNPAIEFCPAIHPGAAAFYDKDKPTFIQAHADFVGLLLTVILMIGSWIWQLKGWMERRQKTNADEYTNRAIALMREAEAALTVEALARARQELLALLSDAVRDLDADKLSETSFASFRAVLQIAIGVARERRDTLQTASPEAAQASAV